MKFMLIFTVFALMSNGQIPVVETQRFRSLENCQIVGKYLVEKTKKEDRYNRLKLHVDYACIELKTIIIR